MVQCFVTGCSIGFLRCKEKITKFRAPRDEKQFILWQKAIPRSDSFLPFNKNPVIIAKKLENVFQTISYVSKFN